MNQNSGSLFLFLMDLAWHCRLSLPILLTCSMALIGQACVLHINITTHTVREQELDAENTDSATDDSTTSDIS